MFCTIVEKSQIIKCQNMGICECMSDDKILKWNNDKTKALFYTKRECVHCSIQASIYTESNISNLLKFDPEWINKSIV